VAYLWILIKPDKLHASLDVYLVMPAMGKLAPPQNIPVKQCIFIMEPCSRPPVWHVHQWRTDVTQRNFWLCNKHLTALLEDDDTMNIKLQLPQLVADWLSSEAEATPKPDTMTQAPVEADNVHPTDDVHPKGQEHPADRVYPLHKVPSLEYEGKRMNKLSRSLNRIQRQTEGLYARNPYIGKIFNTLLTLVSFSVFFYAGWQSWSGKDQGVDFSRLIGGVLFIGLAVAIDFLKSFWGGDSA
jgi:hypothetical protein